MTVHVVTAELTLASRIPAMAAQQADGQASFAAAAAGLDELVRTLSAAATERPGAVAGRISTPAH